MIGWVLSSGGRSDDPSSWTPHSFSPCDSRREETDLHSTSRMFVMVIDHRPLSLVTPLSMVLLGLGLN